MNRSDVNRKRRLPARFTDAAVRAKHSARSAMPATAAPKPRAKRQSRGGAGSATAATNVSTAPGLVNQDLLTTPRPTMTSGTTPSAAAGTMNPSGLFNSGAMDNTAGPENSGCSSGVPPTLVAYAPTMPTASGTGHQPSWPNVPNVGTSGSNITMDLASHLTQGPAPENFPQVSSGGLHTRVISMEEGKTNMGRPKTKTPGTSQQKTAKRKASSSQSDETDVSTKRPKLSKTEKASGTVTAGASVFEEEVRKREEYTASLPERNMKGELVFSDHPELHPNMTPAEVLQAGSFGGTYFRPIKSGVTGLKYSGVWKELPKDWLEGLNISKEVSSSVYNSEVNTYKAKCGGSLEMWESSGWMNEQDPYGWFQWYCRFYLGRRTDDDERQIGRWSRCTGVKGRWRNNLIAKCVRSGCAYDNFAVSPVVRQTLQHWGYKLTKEDFDQGAKRVK